MDYLDELKDRDSRQGEEYGSPYECIHPDGDRKQNAVCLISVTGPRRVFVLRQRLCELAMRRRRGKQLADTVTFVLLCKIIYNLVYGSKYSDKIGYHTST